mgnify:CR=1 FL=1
MLKLKFFNFLKKSFVKYLYIIMIDSDYITQWSEEGYTVIRDCIPDKLIHSANF